jgi:hypothetical protein
LVGFQRSGVVVDDPTGEIFIEQESGIPANSDRLDVPAGLFKGRDSFWLHAHLLGYFIQGHATAFS